jgi:hypothetical protein
MAAPVHVTGEPCCASICEKTRLAVHRQHLSCGYLFDQTQGGKSIAHGRVIPSGQLLGAVASPSLGWLPDEPRVLAHGTLPPWELTS